MPKDFRATTLERAIGRQLAGWRDERELSLTEAGQRVGFSSAKLSMMENAVQPSAPVDVMALGYVYKVPTPEWQAVVLRAQYAEQVRRRSGGDGPNFDPAADFVNLVFEATLLRAFGLDGVAPDEIAAVFRGLATRRQFTLLLDNADSAEQVMPLLPASGTVLVTSRSKLNLPQAQEIGVEPLADDGRLGPLLDRSYVELPERQARLYRLCAWEPDAFGVPVAAAIAGEAECDVEDALDDLVEKSLLTEVGDYAFRFHDLVRAHARAKRYQS